MSWPRPRRHTRLLYIGCCALASVGVFAEETDGRFALTPLAEHLQTDAPGSLRAWAMLIGQPSFWSSWGHLLHSVRTGEPAFPDLHGMNVWEHRETHPEEGVIFPIWPE